eukprot:6295336-Amphidinium_carterae.2
MKVPLVPGPSRAAPRREPIGPKRAAPPRDHDANKPKRPARAPVHGPEPDAEPIDRAHRRPVPPAVPPPGGNPRLPTLAPLDRQGLNLLRRSRAYQPIVDNGASASCAITLLTG